MLLRTPVQRLNGCVPFSERIATSAPVRGPRIGAGAAAELPLHVVVEAAASLIGFAELRSATRLPRHPSRVRKWFFWQQAGWTTSSSGTQLKSAECGRARLSHTHCCPHRATARLSMTQGVSVFMNRFPPGLGQLQTLSRVALPHTACLHDRAERTGPSTSSFATRGCFFVSPSEIRQRGVNERQQTEPRLGNAGNYSLLLRLRADCAHCRAREPGSTRSTRWQRS